MATHSFVCNKCNISIQDNTTKGIHKCPLCGEDMFLNCRIAIHGNYRQPVHSDSLAIVPSQRAEHERLFPNIRLDSECRPIFDNYVDHRNYLKKTGFAKATQKLKPKGKKLSIK